MTMNARAAPSADLYIGFLQTIDSLNPYIGLNDPSYFLYGLLYDYPFAFDAQGNFIPNIITSATHDASGFNWTYTVRSGVTWSDGTTLTAKDVAFTWNYDSQNLSSLWAYEPYFNQVVQCTKYNVGHCGAVISSTNSNQVTLYFKRPFAAGEDLFGPIVQAAQWSSVKPACAGGTAGCGGSPYQNANPIGTGPFIADPSILTEVQNQLQAGVYIHVSRNPHYHAVGTTISGSSDINIQNIYIEIFQDPTALATSLNKGYLQLAQFTPSTIKQVKGTSGVLVQSGLQVIQEWNEIGITQIDTPKVDSKLNPARFDVNVRRAMAMATNKDYIIQQYYYGQGQRGDTLISPVTPQWWYDPVAGGDNLTFDIKAANALLNQSGYTTWTGGSFGNGYRAATNAITVSFQSSQGTTYWNVENVPNVTKTVPAGTVLTFNLETRPSGAFPEEAATGAYLAQQYAKVGINLIVTNALTEDALSKDVYAGAVEMYIWYWSADPDPNYMLSMESSWTLDGWNDNSWVNTSYNQAYLAQLADFNLNQRIKDVQAAEKINYDLAPYIIYIYPFGEWAMHTDVVPGGQQWTGWGNWNTDPYMQMSAFWGANPLFFNLTCPTCAPVTSNPPPTPPVIQSPTYSTWYVNKSQTVTATSSDPDPGDTLNFTWTWGDGSQTYCPANQVVANCSSSGGTSTATHAYNRTTNATTGPYTISVSASDGYTGVPTQHPIYVNVSAPPATFGWLAGVVKNQATGSPIQGATVSTSPGGVVSSATAGDGLYNITLAPGSYTASATAPFFGASAATPATITANHTTTLDFQLTPNIGWIAGTVTSSATNTPLAGASIYVTEAGGTQTSGSTDAQGHYNVSVEPGLYIVNASATGYQPASKTGIRVNSSQTSQVAFALAPVVETPVGLSPLVIGVIAAVVLVAVAALAAVFLSRRRKKKEEKESKIELPPKSP